MTASVPAWDYTSIFATIGRGDIEDLVTATGSLQPRDYVDVGAQVSGQVERILVQVGDEVYRIRTITDEKASDGSIVTSVYAEAAFYDLTYF